MKIDDKIFKASLPCVPYPIEFEVSIDLYSCNLFITHSLNFFQFQLYSGQIQNPIHWRFVTQCSGVAIYTTILTLSFLYFTSFLFNTYQIHIKYTTNTYLIRINAYYIHIISVLYLY